MTDPIEDPSFNIMRAREANPERINRIRELARQWRMHERRAEDVRDEMAQEIRAAKAAGHSFPQLAKAAGVSIGTIQRIVDQP